MGNSIQIFEESFGNLTDDNTENDKIAINVVTNASDIIAAGSYTDTLTFSASIASITSVNP